MKKFAFVSLLILALAAGTGCLGGSVDGIDADISPDTEPVETNETGEEILASAVEASEDAEAYSVEGEHRFVGGASGIFEINFTMESTGSFDTGDREALVETDGTADFSFLILDNTTEFETSVYSDGNKTWRRSVENGEETGWSAREGNFTYTESVLGVGAVEEAYADFDAELLGGETVDGVETYVVSVNASPERLSRHSSAIIRLHGDGIEERDHETATDGEPNVEGEPNIEATKEAYLWVERDTRRPVRMAHRISIGSSDDGGEASEGGNATDGASEGEGGEGGDAGDAGVDFLFVADWSYGDGEVEPPEGVSSSGDDGA